MKKSIFKMEVVIDTEEKSLETHIGMNQKDFDPEAVIMLKDVISSMSQAIAIGYTKKILSFSDGKESEVKA